MGSFIREEKRDTTRPNYFNINRAHACPMQMLVCYLRSPYLLFLVEKNKRDGSPSWGDIVESSESRPPGRAVQMHKKLSSPSRKRFVSSFFGVKIHHSFGVLIVSCRSHRYIKAYLHDTIFRITFVLWNAKVQSPFITLR